MDFHGARYLHILVPCPLGWGSSPADTIKVARLAVESALFPVFEAESGEVVSATPIRRQVPVTDYLRLQARYAHLFRPEERTDVIARIEASADRNVSRFGLLQDYPERTRPALPGEGVTMCWLSTVAHADLAVLDGVPGVTFSRRDPPSPATASSTPGITRTPPPPSGRGWQPPGACPAATARAAASAPRSVPLRRDRHGS